MWNDTRGLGRGGRRSHPSRRTAREGVSFPSVDGRRSTSATGRAILADAARAADPELAERILTCKDWRRGYAPLVRELTAASIPDGGGATLDRARGTVVDALAAHLRRRRARDDARRGARRGATRIRARHRGDPGHGARRHRASRSLPRRRALRRSAGRAARPLGRGRVGGAVVRDGDRQGRREPGLAVASRTRRRAGRRGSRDRPARAAVLLGCGGARDGRAPRGRVGADRRDRPRRRREPCTCRSPPTARREWTSSATFPRRTPGCSAAAGPRTSRWACTHTPTVATTSA